MAILFRLQCAFAIFFSFRWVLSGQCNLTNGKYEVICYTVVKEKLPSSNVVASSNLTIFHLKTGTTHPVWYCSLLMGLSVSRLTWDVIVERWSHYRDLECVVCQIDTRWEWWMVWEEILYYLSTLIHGFALQCICFVYNILSINWCKRTSQFYPYPWTLKLNWQFVIYEILCQ